MQPTGYWADIGPVGETGLVETCKSAVIRNHRLKCGCWIGNDGFASELIRINDKSFRVTFNKELKFKNTTLAHYINSMPKELRPPYDFVFPRCTLWLGTVRLPCRHHHLSTGSTSADESQLTGYLRLSALFLLHHGPVSVYVYMCV